MIKYLTSFSFPLTAILPAACLLLLHRGNEDKRRFILSLNFSNTLYSYRILVSFFFLVFCFQYFVGSKQMDKYILEKGITENKID
jgi:hypothetical protein